LSQICVNMSFLYTTFKLATYKDICGHHVLSILRLQLNDISRCTCWTSASSVSYTQLEVIDGRLWREMASLNQLTRPITFGGCYGMILFRSPIHIEDSGKTSRLFDKTRRYVLSPHGVTWHHDLSCICDLGLWQPWSTEDDRKNISGTSYGIDWWIKYENTPFQRRLIIAINIRVCRAHY